MQKKYLVVGLIAAIVLLGVVIIFSKSQNSGPVCVQFIHTIEKNDAKGAYKYFTPDAQKATNLDDWTQTVKFLSINYNHQEPKLVSSSTTGDSTSGGNTPEAKSSNKNATTWDYYTVGQGAYTFNITCIVQGSKISGFVGQ